VQYNDAMKLATLKDGTRDGQLVVVSRDLKTAHVADGIAPSLQAALDDWAFIAPQLQTLYGELNADRARRAFDFDPARCMAPLPRAYAFVEACAWPSHAERLRQAGMPALPASQADEPVLWRATSDAFLGPHDPIELPHDAGGIDVAGGLAVITDDVPAGATPDVALGRIRLLLLTNAVTQRLLAASELERGCGLLAARPATAFAPVAVTPEALGDAWRDAKIRRPLRVACNGGALGQPDAGEAMAVNFAQLVAHLCTIGDVAAGTVVAAGPVSGRKVKGGFACIAERRAQEIIDTGEPVTPYLRFGDTVRIEMLDEAGKSVFGAIEATVAPQERSAVKRGQHDKIRPS
jgi:fumarylacetoacetate (FAA) hydrolase